MKKLLSILFLFFTITSFGANRYFANAGDNATSGTENAPWQTISRLNNIALNAGDSIFFKRGDVFSDAGMVIKNSGTPGNVIYIGAYGKGSNPVITGFANITSWTSLGNNIWESNAISNLPYTNLIAINDINTAMGRTPNTGSYYEYQSHAAKPLINSVTSGNLNSKVINWTGAEAAISITSFRIVRNPITAQHGGTIIYTPDHEGAGFQSNSGNLIIQNDLRTLDQNGEWYYNPSSHKLAVYNAGARPTGVQIPAIDTLCYLENSGYVTIENIDFTGANMNLFNINNSNHVSIQSCNFQFSGIDGIFARTGISNYVTINNCRIKDINNNGIDLNNGTCANASVTNNMVAKCGLIYGEIDRNDGANNANTAQAISARGASALIKGNRIDSMGFMGIMFLGSNSIIENNYITNFCMLLDDGGGIYTMNNGTNTVQSNVQVLNNIIDNHKNSQNINGADYGIYLDDFCNNILVKGNTAANCSWGYEVHNSFNIILDSNIAYNNSMASLYARVDNSGGVSGYLTDNNNLTLTRNIFFAARPLQKTTWFDSRDKFGVTAKGFVADHNKYCRPIDNNGPSIFTNLNNTAVADRTLSIWKKYSGQDANSETTLVPVTSQTQLYFVYNTSNHDSTFAIPAGKWTDIQNKPYKGSTVIKPFQSLILINAGSKAAPSASSGKTGNWLLAQIVFHEVNFYLKSTIL